MFHKPVFGPTEAQGSTPNGATSESPTVRWRKLARTILNPQRTATDHTREASGPSPVVNDSSVSGDDCHEAGVKPVPSRTLNPALMDPTQLVFVGRNCFER